MESTAILILIVAFGLIAGLVVAGILNKVFHADEPVKKVVIKTEPKKKKKSRSNIAQNPTFNKLSTFVQKVFPESQESSDAQRKSLMRAGLKISTSKLWSLRVISLAVFLIIGLGLSSLIGSATQSVAVVIVFSIIGFAIPQLYVLKKRDSWRSQIQVQMPDAIDLLCMTVSAGATFDAGLREVAQRMEGTFAEACQDVIEESKFTRTIDAMQRFADNAQVPTLTNMVSAVRLAMDTGTPIAQPLSEQARLARDMRRLELEKKAQKLDTKMIFPLGFLALPAYIMILLVPFFLQGMQNFMAM